MDDIWRNSPIKLEFYSLSSKSDADIQPIVWVVGLVLSSVRAFEALLMYTLKRGGDIISLSCTRGIGFTVKHPSNPWQLPFSHTSLTWWKTCCLPFLLFGSWSYSCSRSINMILCWLSYLQLLCIQRSAQTHQQRGCCLAASPTHFHGLPFYKMHMC